MVADSAAVPGAIVTLLDSTGVPLADSAASPVMRLDFAPVPARRLPDIRGVITLDRATAELRALEFQYVNLRVGEQAGSPGGELAFRRLPEGSWIIEYWAIGIPFLEQRVNRDEIRPVPGRGGLAQPAPRPPTVVTANGRVTTGGAVTRLLFGDTVVWAASEVVMPRMRMPLPP